ENVITTGSSPVVQSNAPTPQFDPSTDLPLGPRMSEFPEVTGSAAGDRQAESSADAQHDITGNSSGAPAHPAAAKSEKPPDGKVIQLDAKPAPSPSERAILERLQERRQELESRDREIELRENLLKAAEKKLQSQAGEVRDQEANAAAALQKKEQAEAERLK